MDHLSQANEFQKIREPIRKRRKNHIEKPSRSNKVDADDDCYTEEKIVLLLKTYNISEAHMGITNLVH